jgi:beta-N-acetylhexosaminidase
MNFPSSPEKAPLHPASTFARMQAEDLSALGINLNFSPVVDLKPEHRLNRLDLHTRIDLRAIASDPQTVSEVALEYCKGLNAGGIMPTLKHFPGLASVNADTHFHLGVATHSLKELKEQDWPPFQNILTSTEAFVMLGHVLVPEVDETYPASLSRKLIQKVLRRDWGFDGVLITDDFSMGAIVSTPGGVESASVRALNAGVDLILIAYDGELYYPAMLALLKAESRGELAEGFLDQSEARLTKIENLKKGEPNENGVDRPLSDAELTGRERQDAFRKSLLRKPEKRALRSGLGPSSLRS